MARSAAAVSVEKYGLPVPAREDHRVTAVQVAHGAAANVRLGQLLDLDGRHHARRHARALERVLQRERVDDRGQHAHVVALRAIHAFAGAAQAAEDVAAADHQAELHAGRVDLGELGRGLFQRRWCRCPSRLLCRSAPPPTA